LGVKEYRGGTSPVASRMSDNEDTPASLRDSPSKAFHSDMLSVQHPPGNTIPAVCQEPEEGAKVPSAAAGQNTGDVLPDHPAGAQVASQAAKVDGQIAARVIQAKTSARDREALAGGAADKQVNRSGSGSAGERRDLRGGDTGKISKVWHSVG
jgi:hypothetical protein